MNNLGSCKIKAWKKFSPERIQTMTFVILLQCPTNWAIKPTGSCPHCEFVRNTSVTWLDVYYKIRTFKFLAQSLHFHLWFLLWIVCRMTGLHWVTQRKKKIVSQRNLLKIQIRYLGYELTNMKYIHWACRFVMLQENLISHPSENSSLPLFSSWNLFFWVTNLEYHAV